MRLHDPTFLNFGGEPVTGRTPPTLLVKGDELTREQLGEVKYAYKLFRDALRVSITPYLVQHRVLADGTTVKMVSINGVDTVTVAPPPVAVVIQTNALWVMVRAFKVTGSTAEAHSILYRLPPNMDAKRAQQMYSGVTQFPSWSSTQAETNAPGSVFSVGAVGAIRGFYPQGDKAFMWSFGPGVSSPSIGFNKATMVFDSSSVVYELVGGAGERPFIPISLAKKQANYVVQTISGGLVTASRFEQFMLDGSGTVGVDPDGVTPVAVGTFRSTPPYSRREIGTYTQGPASAFDPNRGTTLARIFDRHYNLAFTFGSTRHPVFYVDGQFIEVTDGSAVTDMTFSINDLSSTEQFRLALLDLPGLAADSFVTGILSAVVDVKHGAISSGDFGFTQTDASFIYSQATGSHDYIQVTFITDQSGVRWPA